MSTQTKSEEKREEKRKDEVTAWIAVFTGLLAMVFAILVLALIPSADLTEWHFVMATVIVITGCICFVAGIRLGNTT